MQKYFTAESQRFFWVGMEYRYIRSIKRLIEEVDKGTVGNLHMVSIREHRFPFLKRLVLGIV